MTQENGSLQDKVISKIAEASISSQLDEVDDLEVNVKADPLKLAQGKVEGVEIAGKGMVIQKDLRMEEMVVETGPVAVNPMGVILGNVELTHPTDATAQVVLTESDINRAFRSEYIQRKLKGMTLNVNGELQTIDIRPLDFRLPGRGKIFMDVELRFVMTGEIKRISFTATPQFQSDSQKILLEDIEYSETGILSPELTYALQSAAAEVLDLRNFELKNMQFNVQNFDVIEGKILLNANAFIEQIPDGSFS